MKTISETPRTREFANGVSSFRLLDGKSAFKKVHINGDKAAMFWFVNMIPIIGSEYYSLNNLPNFIKSNILKLDNIIGKECIEILDMSGKCVQQLHPSLFNTKESVIECFESWGLNYEMVVCDYSKKISKAVVYEN